MDTFYLVDLMKRNLKKPSAGINLGFQIAPMIDVVFVIMLFFMVMAGQVQVEQELNLKLPGTIAGESPPSVEETQVRVLDNGAGFAEATPTRLGSRHSIRPTCRRFAPSLAQLAMRCI